MSGEETYVPGAVRWLLVIAVVGLVLVAAFWRPEPAVTRPGPFGILTERTWVEGSAYGVLTLAVLYALSPGGSSAAISPLVVPVFVVLFACFVEIGQAGSGATAFQAIDLIAATVCSMSVALAWDAGQHVFDRPPV
mgnify:CR=1 FL=1